MWRYCDNTINPREEAVLTATVEPIGAFPFELEEEELPGSVTGVGPDTLDHLRDVQDLIDRGEKEENIARFIAGHPAFTPAERVIARLVLRRHGLLRHVAV